MDVLHPVNVMFTVVLPLIDLEALELVISMVVQEMVNAVFMVARLMMGIMETVTFMDVQQTEYVTPMGALQKIVMTLTTTLTEELVISMAAQVTENVTSMVALPLTGLEDQEAVTFTVVQETVNAIFMAARLMMGIMVNVTAMAVQQTVHVIPMVAPKDYK